MWHGLVKSVSKIEFRPRLVDWLLIFKKRSIKLKTSKPWVRCALSNVLKQRFYFYTFLFKLANSQLILVLVEIASRLLICARRRQSTIELPRLFAYLLDLPPMYILMQLLIAGTLSCIFFCSYKHSCTHVFKFQIQAQKTFLIVISHQGLKIHVADSRPL